MPPRLLRPLRLVEREERRERSAAGLQRGHRVRPLAGLRAAEDDTALAIERRREGPVAGPRRDADRYQLAGIGLGRVYAVDRALRLSGIHGHGEQPTAGADQERAERHLFRFGQRHDGQITAVLIANHEPFGGADQEKPPGGISGDARVISKRNGPSVHARAVAQRAHRVQPLVGLRGLRDGKESRRQAQADGCKAYGESRELRASHCVLVAIRPNPISPLSRRQCPAEDTIGAAN